LLLIFSSIFLVAWCYLAGNMLCLRLTKADTSKTTYCSLLVGIYILYTLPLSGLSIHTIKSILYLSIIFLLLLFIKSRPRISTSRSTGLLPLFILSTPLLGGILFEPISSWDARSIWFFQGKIMYYSNQLSSSIDYSKGLSIGYDAHMDYPKLIAFLSAVNAHLAGIWNEYIPKHSLLLLYCAALSGLTSLRHTPLPARILFLAAWTFAAINKGAGQTVDVWLSFFTAMAFFYYYELINDLTSDNFVCLALTILILPMIKNEGKAIASLLFFSIALDAPVRTLTINTLRHNSKALILLAIPLIPIIEWEIWKSILHVKVDLDFTSSNSFSRLISRLTKHDILTYFQQVATFRNILITVFAMLSYYLLQFTNGDIKKQHQTKTTSRFLLTFCVLYTTILTWIYFTTYHNFSWHLETSAYRVFSPILMLLIAYTSISATTIAKRFFRQYSTPDA